MKEALGADLGSGGKRDPYSEYFLSQLHWSQSTTSWSLESGVQHGHTKKHLWAASVKMPRELDCPLAGSNKTGLPYPFLGSSQSTHRG